jgi:hypothetical protein
VVLRLVVGLLSLSALAFGGPAVDASSGRVYASRVVGEGQVSSNWAGYALTGTNSSGAPTTYTNVVGSWVQPKVTCTARQPSYSAFWVGLGGFSVDASRSVPSRIATRAGGPSMRPGTRSCPRRRSRLR